MWTNLSMVSKLKKIAAKNVGMGMYIAKLDRPWLDAAFLFQGFYVRNQDDVNEIIHQCEYVYIDEQGAPKDVKNGSLSCPLGGGEHMSSNTQNKKINEEKNFKYCKCFWL